MTYIARKGGTVEAATSWTLETVEHARAQVGDDARLGYFDFAVETTFSQAKRASQWTAHMAQGARVDVALARAGQTSAYGDYHASVGADLSRLSLYASRAEVAAAEQKLGASLLESLGRDAFASEVKDMLNRLGTAEDGWNEDNRCVKVEFSPEAGTRSVAVGERGSFTGRQARMTRKAIRFALERLPAASVATRVAR